MARVKLSDILEFEEDSIGLTTWLTKFGDELVDNTNLDVSIDGSLKTLDIMIGDAVDEIHILIDRQNYDYVFVVEITENDARYYIVPFDKLGDIVIIEYDGEKAMISDLESMRNVFAWSG